MHKEKEKVKFIEQQYHTWCDILQSRKAKLMSMGIEEGQDKLVTCGGPRQAKEFYN